jgi:hypothetical protein
MRSTISTTNYSERIPGEPGNHHFAVRFDLTTGGYVGISQYEGEGLTDRVLLSPTQVRVLVAFVRAGGSPDA